MAADEKCPAHLVGRLRALHGHVLALAADLDREPLFSAEIEGARERAQRALAGGTRDLVEASITEQRRLARDVYQAGQREKSVPR